MSFVPSARKFSLDEPAQQNAVDIFEGSWVSDFGEICPEVKAGTAPFFTADPRPDDCARLLGSGGRLDGMRILELGPLEGAHTYKLEKLGAASILAIEGNAQAYLKCLITKEIIGLRAARFLHGDFTRYLASARETFDLVFCSGVLYHIVDPVAAILDIGRLTDKCFVWTHYYDEKRYDGPARQARRDPLHPDVELFVQEFAAEEMEDSAFFGGTRPKSVWLSREDLLATFRKAGLAHIEIVEDDVAAEIGPTLTFAARRD